jgi:hypothetical protein
MLGATTFDACGTAPVVRCAQKMLTSSTGRRQIADPDHCSSSIGSGSAASSTNSSLASSASIFSPCTHCLLPKRSRGVNPQCSNAVSMTTCSGDHAPSGIRSLPAWAFPSWQPWSRTGGRPRPWSWSLPRCACASCCTGGGGSRLPPIANKQHCSTQPAAPSQTVDLRTTARHFGSPASRQCGSRSVVRESPWATTEAVR